MFEGALNRGPAAKPRLVTGTAMSIALHGALLAGALWLSSRTPPEPPEPPEKDVPKVYLDPKRVRKATGGQAVAQRPARPKPLARKIRTGALIVPRNPLEKPPELEPPPEAPPDDGPDSADPGPGHALGECEGPDCEDPPDCPEGGCALGTPPDDFIYVYDTRMTRPQKLEGTPPEYTREALEARIQGVMVVKCVVTVSGALERCRVIKPLPFMEGAVLDALARWRYAPATLDGRAIAVDYVFQLSLRLPR